jgi:hypothetical protein
MTAQRDHEQRKIGSQQWLEGEAQGYLFSGDYDSSFAGLQGDYLVDVAQRATHRLRTALVGETLRRTHGFLRPLSVPADLNAWVRSKLWPMVHGLLPVEKRSVILDDLSRNVVFLTPENIPSVLMGQTWLSTAWNLANLYLASVGAIGLSRRASNIVGLSEETKCYVSMSYFDERDPFVDFVVHEVAHVFQGSGASPAGLGESRPKEGLLNIDYAKCETFAYACEAYSCISSMAVDLKQRQKALKRYADGALPPDDRVNHREYLSLLDEAVGAHNGWQTILRRCAPG